MGPKYTWVMTLTFLSHLSSVMWPSESQWSISYWWSIGTKSVYPAVFEVLSNKHIGLTTLTFQGHVTSSVTWPFDSQVDISYRCSIGSWHEVRISSPAVFLDGPYLGYDLDFSMGHLTSSVTWPFESQYVISYWWSIGSKSLSLTGFWDIVPQTSCAHRQAQC